LEPLDGVTKVLVNSIGRLAHVTHYNDKITAFRLVEILNKYHLGASLVNSSNKDSDQNNNIIGWRFYLMII
jgi:hypothetical protein